MEGQSSKMEMDQSTDVNNHASSPAVGDSDVASPVENVTIGPGRTKPIMKVDPSELGSGNRKPILLRSPFIVVIN